MSTTNYSKEFKSRVVKTFLERGHRPSKEISQEFGIALSTLYVWVAAAANEKVDENETILSPEQWPPNKRLQAISVYDSLSNEERGEFLRSSGLTMSHVEKWRQMLYSALETRDLEKQKLERKIRV